MNRYEMPDSIKKLCVLAQAWQNASHNEASGWGAGSRMMADSHDRAKAQFVAELARTRPAEIADALAALLAERSLTP